jgi:cyclohexa-1,5-dienecarbonyl-CoA hydratase
VSGGAIGVDRSAGGIVTLGMDRPPGNVLGIDMCGQLEQEITAAAADPAAKLLVVTSLGKHFSFGASVEEHLPEQAQEMLAAMGAVVERLYAHPYPTLAAVRGSCLGGGLELALTCDMLVLEESATLAAPEIRLGVFAPAATVLLQSSVPRSVAAEVLFTGRDLSAEEAVRFGLANRVVADGTLDDTVGEMAERYFRPRSAASLRQATRAFRGACRGRSPARLAEDLGRVEHQYVTELLPLHDGTEGIRAFLEKRDPLWEAEQ